jgi:hypothetical protein
MTAATILFIFICLGFGAMAVGMALAGHWE